MKVESLVTGADREVEGATVRVCSSSGRPTVLRRPLQLLYLLEVRDDAGSVTDSRSSEPASRPSQLKQSPATAPELSGGSRRPQRDAARRAKEIIRIVAKDSQA